MSLSSSDAFKLSTYDSLLSERDTLKHENELMFSTIQSLKSTINDLISRAETSAVQHNKLKKRIDSQAITINNLSSTIDDLNEQILSLECNHDKRIIERTKRAEALAAERMRKINELENYIRKLEIRNKDLSLATFELDTIPKSRSFP